MKVKMYMDVFQGWSPLSAYAYSNPSWKKPSTAKRLSFTVDIPEHLISLEVDMHVQETSDAKEVK